MRQPRIKFPATEGDATYHCISRTVNGEWLFTDSDKEMLRRQLWQVADYCGVQVITYCILSNHFHILVRVPKQQPVSDRELLRRYRVMYPTPTPFQSANLKAIEADLERGGPEAENWRKRQVALMGDVSQYMKLLKQRFSIWFNKSHARFGTLWAERFKSLLVESDSRVLQNVAAYIDLNSVRAGLVTDPKDYRFCGYAEAVAGNNLAQAGLQFAIANPGWSDTQAAYRTLLFGAGAGPRESATVAPSELEKVLAEGGRLPITTVLRCRLRYFTDGAVLGSRVFVEAQISKYHQRCGRREGSKPRPLPLITDWDDLTALRGFRLRLIG
jgi:putative transposase